MTTPTIQQIKEFYPISGSITDERISETKDYVLNHTFLKMFGFSASTGIIDGSIANLDSPLFIGFEKFLALCIAYQLMKDPLTSTNFGGKIISRQNVVDPANNQKSITLIEMENTISIHYRYAIRALNVSKCGIELPEWGGYFSYKVEKI